MSKRFVSRVVATMLTLAMVVSSNSFSIFATGFDNSDNDSEIITEESIGISFNDENENNLGTEVIPPAKEEINSEDLSDDETDEDVSENSTEEADSEENVSEDADVSEEDTEEPISENEDVIGEDGLELDGYIIHSGQSEGVKWEISNKHVLTIKGESDWNHNDLDSTWLQYADIISSVKFEDYTNANDVSGMFLGCTQLESIDFSGFNTSEVTNMSSMFWGCESLEEIDLSELNTSEVRDMSAMFQGCKNLGTITFGDDFDTDEVQNMGYMFADCSSLETLDLSNFNTEKVNNMVAMFSGCSGLEELELEKFNTSKVTSMQGMFDKCSGLKSLDISTFNTGNVTNMSYMFNDCNQLTSLNLGNISTTNVTNMSAMFSDCSSLTSLNLSKFSTSKVQSMKEMFKNCESLTSLDISEFTSNQLGKTVSMFEGCTGLKELISGDFSAYNVTDMSAMFSGCSSLKSLNLSKFHTSSVKSMKEMFKGCSGLTSLNISSFNTDNVTEMGAMFCDCSNLTELDLSSFKIHQNVGNDLFIDGCTQLVKIVTPYYCHTEFKLSEEGWMDSTGKSYSVFPRDVSVELTLASEYKITYVLGSSAKNNSANPSSYKKDESVTLKDPTRTGYSFDGWYDNENFNGEKITVVKGGNVKLYAKWIEHTYTITLIGNGGKFMLEDDETPKSTHSIPDVKYSQNLSTKDLGNGLSRPGYKLIGWKNSNGKLYTIGKQTSIHNLTDKNNGNVKLTAQWELIKYTVKFDNCASEYNNGDFAGEMADLIATYSKSVKLPANKYTRKGYTFKGWALEPNATKAKYKNKASVKNLATEEGEVKTLYAVWAINTYSVKYNLNGSKGNAPTKATGLQYGVQEKRLVVADVPANASFAKEGSLYTFKGWSTKAGGEVEFTAGETTDAIAKKNNSTITLYAVWKYDFTINDNLPSNGANEKRKEANYNGKITVTDFSMNQINTYTKTDRNPGYYIAGWNTDSNKASKGKIKYKLNAKIKNIAGKTLYAVWKPVKYTVKFDKNAPAGAKVTGKMSNITATYGKAFTLKANAYKCSGYKFAGWATEPQGKNIKYTNKQKITDNLSKENKATVTLYAVWEKTK